MTSANHAQLDLFVMGAGSGGLAAAKRAASHGAKVVIAEMDRVGGTCVIRGCIPKKLMHYAAHLGALRDLAVDYGWAPGPRELNWKTLCERRDAAIRRLEEMHERALAQAGVEMVRGRAELQDNHTVTVGNRTFTAKHILIATGGEPLVPFFEGSGCCMSSDGFFKLDQLPRSATIVGGSYIAVEFASLLQGVGCQVTMLVRSTILRNFDRDVGGAVLENLRHRGVVVHEQTEIGHMERRGGGGTVVTTHARCGGESLTVEADSCVIFAAGRNPRTCDIGLEGSGVRLDDAGAVVVDADHVTSVPHIYAIGDVINRLNLTPVAIRAGRTLADRVFAGKKVSMSYEKVPTAVFCDPPAAGVGMTEAEAKDRHGENILTFAARFVPLIFSLSAAERKEKTFMKLIVRRDTDEVLGCHMVGPDAPEIIQSLAVAVQARLTKADFDATAALHPSQAEEFVLMR